MGVPSCLDCLRGHLACAKSFAREILDGHGQGGNPDHREDFSGELYNAERHASLIDHEFTLKIRFLRRELQKRFWNPIESDLRAISVLWHHSYTFDQQIFDKIKEEDQQLYKTIVLKSQVYKTLKTTESESDVAKDCGCVAKEEKKEKKVIVIIESDGKDDRFKNALQKNLEQHLVGFNSIEERPTGFFEFPKFEDFDETKIYILWPKNIYLVRICNPFSIPDLEDEKGNELGENEINFLESEHKKHNKFVELPLMASPSMLNKICEDFASKTGVEKISDVFSVVRNFMLSVPFPDTENVVIDNSEQRTVRTLFRRFYK